MGSVHRILGLVAVVATTISCGDLVRQGRGPVYLVIDSLTAAAGNKPTQFGGTLLSDVITNVSSPLPCTQQSPCPTIFNDFGQVTFRLSLKDITNPAGVTTNNEVTITRYHVTYRRADGRNTPGVDVPYGFDGATTATVPAGGSASVSFEIVRHAAKQESPLAQLAANPNIITTIADVTFYGRDRVGNEITVTGTIQIDFGNFGDG